MNQVEVATHTGLILPAWGKKVAKHPPKKGKRIAWPLNVVSAQMLGFFLRYCL